VEWIIVILGHLLFIALSAACGLLPVFIIEVVFHEIASYHRTEPEPSQVILEQELEEIDDPELVF